MRQNGSGAWARVTRWYANNGWFGYTAIFVIAFLFFAVFQYNSIFADPDAFYHAGAAVQLRDGQFSDRFTALPFTTLASSYADQHFLFHVLLVPFVAVIDPLVGLKLATIAFGSLMAVVFYWFLRRQGVPWAFATTVLLLLVNPFTFRMNLAKASSLSLTILLLGLTAAFAYRSRWLALVAFAYVWTYGGFMLLPIAVVTFAVVGIWHRKVIRREDANRFIHRLRALLGRAFRHNRIRRLNLRIVLAVLVGTALGLALNPFFPDNLRFYLDQLIRIGVVNYQHTIGVGGEWYPYKFVDLVANTVLVSIPLIVTLVLFVIRFRRQSPRAITLGILWAFFFVLTLKSRRYVEYSVPFGLLFSAVSLHDSLRGIRFRELWQQVRRSFVGSLLARIGIVGVATYVAIMVPTIVTRDLVSERRDLLNGFRLDLFRSESTWMRDHADPGAVVFHSDWDEFPILYYNNPQLRYIAGLDPTFLYVADANRYWQWANVTLGRESGDVYRIIRGTFGASFVFVEHDHEAMKRLIEADRRFSVGFIGPEATVYRVE